MDEKTKLYVFSKREVALIFLFMFLIALTSFVFGVKIGKSYSYSESGLTPQDRQRVELLSDEEEIVNEVVEKVKKESELKPEMKGPDMEDLNKKLEEHIKEETSDESSAGNGQEAGEVSNQMVEPAPGVEVPAVDNEKGVDKKQDRFSGKYTVQLGSHRSLEEAEAFAEGFRVRGYNPIVNESEVPGRGTWYRVSLGVFDNITEAKDYVKKEASLFQGQEYVFARFE